MDTPLNWLLSFLICLHHNLSIPLLSGTAWWSSLFVLSLFQYGSQPVHEGTLGPFSGEWYLDLGARCVCSLLLECQTFRPSWRSKLERKEGREKYTYIHAAYDKCVYVVVCMCIHNVCVYIYLPIHPSIRNHEFTMIFSVSVQYHRVHPSIHPFCICNSFHHLWKTRLPLFSIYLFAQPKKTK